MQRRFRNYDVINVIDQQDTSSTYLVSISSKPGQKFTLKVFHKPKLLSLATREKFSQEVKTYSRIRHPHVVPMIEGGIEQGSGYIVNEYMPGSSLRVRLDQAAHKPLPFQEAMTIITQLGQALAYLHTQQFVHGHLRPEHVLFDAQGQTLLADIYCPERTWLYDEDTLIDVYRYLSPEQYQDTSGQQLGSAFSDQYALCCIAYELVTGQTPFVDTNILTLKEMQMHAEPASLSSLVPDLPPEVNEAILKGLQKDPAQRHADITTFLAILQPTHTSLLDPDLPVPHEESSLSLSLPPVDEAIEDIPEHEKVWTKVIYESDTTPIMIEPLLAQMAKAPEQLIEETAPQAALQQPSAPKKRSHAIPWITVTVLTVIVISVIGYMLFVTASTPNASVVQGAAKISTTSTAYTTGPRSGPTKTLTPDPKATPTRIGATPTLTATATTTSKGKQPTATPVPTQQPAQSSSKPTPNPLLFTGSLSTRVQQISSSTTAFIPALTVSNVRIEADVINKGDSGGIMFRSNNGSADGYYFRIGTDGSYNFGTPTNTLASNSSSAIKTGNNVSNHITIVAQGSSITIAVNAQTLINITDSSYSSGSVGVVANEFLRSTTTTCNFSIYTD